MNFGLDLNGVIYKDGLAIFFHDITRRGAVNTPRDIHILQNHKHLLNSLGYRTP
jgi:hypothetical protein